MSSYWYFKFQQTKIKDKKNKKNLLCQPEKLELSPFIEDLDINIKTSRPFF